MSTKVKLTNAQRNICEREAAAQQNAIANGYTFAVHLHQEGITRVQLYDRRDDTVIWRSA